MTDQSIDAEYQQYRAAELLRRHLVSWALERIPRDELVAALTVAEAGAGIREGRRPIGERILAILA